MHQNVPYSWEILLWVVLLKFSWEGPYPTGKGYTLPQHTFYLDRLSSTEPL